MRKATSSWSGRFWARPGFVNRKRPAAKKPIKMRSLRVEPLEERQLLSINPLGNERLANSYVTGTQRLYDCTEALAADPAGNYLVTWSSDSQGQGMDVFAQRFAANGQPIQSEFRVNATLVNNQMRSSVAVAADGSALIVWESFGQDGDHSGVYGRLVSSNGSLGTEFQISHVPLPEMLVSELR